MGLYCSPQRYLAQNRNVVAGAVLTPSSVKAVTDKIISTPVARVGTASIAVTGAYDGEEEATYDVQIVDADVGVNRISQPVLNGVGTGHLDNIEVTGDPQNFRVELVDLGIAETPATADFEGVQLVARVPGSAGNGIRLNVERDLSFTPQPFSLLTPLKQGDGSANTPLTGSAYEWDTAALRADGTIPPTAHRVTFGQDTNTIYLAYKKYSGTEDQYFFVPAIAHDIPAGTVVNFVTGGRTVTISSPTSADETYEDIVTVYDLLSAINARSQILLVSGVVALDRTPGGQATRELSLRTDAHVEASYGSGTNFANGLVDTFANDTTGTELVTFTCIAVNGSDNPLAHLGAELWKVHGSLSGDQGIATTGIPFVGGVGGRVDWGATIPQHLPDNYGADQGAFGEVNVNYVPRDEGVEPPPIKVRSLALGPNAVSETVTAIYTKRPSGNCLSDDLPYPDLHTPCLGIFDSTSEGGSMDYLADALLRVKALYDFKRDCLSLVSHYVVGMANSGIPSDASASLTTESASASVSATKAEGGSATVTGSADAFTAQEFAFPRNPVGSIYADVGLPSDFEDTIAYFEQGIATLNTVTDTALRSAGFDAWDEALETWNDDWSGTQFNALRRVSIMATVKYRTGVQRALGYAGIQQSGKSDASTVSGDGCWQDYNDPFYWDVTGSVSGKWKPAFNNKPWYSSKDSADGKSTFSTHQVAMQVNVKCPEGLKEGDEFQFPINSAGYNPTYQIGDQQTLPVVAAGNFALSHGVDGTNVETWAVSGDRSGPFALFMYDRSAPNTYSNGGLTFDIVQGGIPFAKSDAFTFGVEGAHYRWRKDGGSWSSPLPVPLLADTLDSGLSIAFTTGAVPSFVTNDMFTFRALQPFAVSNVAEPSPAKWKWDGADATLDIDCHAPVDMDMASMAMHTLPAGCTITLAGGNAPGVFDWGPEPMTQRPGAMVDVMPEQRTSRYLRLVVTNAADAGIGWLWVGMALSTELHGYWTPRRVYKIERGDGGLYQPAKSLGKTIDGDIEWTEASITEEDMQELLSLVDTLKDDDDAPFVFVPNISRPAEAYVARVTDDEIPYPDTSEGNRDAAFDRRYTAKISLSGIYQSAAA